MNQLDSDSSQATPYENYNKEDHCNYTGISKTQQGKLQFQQNETEASIVSTQ